MRTSIFLASCATLSSAAQCTASIGGECRALTAEEVLTVKGNDEGEGCTMAVDENQADVVNVYNDLACSGTVMGFTCGECQGKCVPPTDAPTAAPTAAPTTSPTAASASPTAAAASPTAGTPTTGAPVKTTTVTLQIVFSAALSDAEQNALETPMCDNMKDELNYQAGDPWSCTLTEKTGRRLLTVTYELKIEAELAVTPAEITTLNEKIAAATCPTSVTAVVPSSNAITGGSVAMVQEGEPEFSSASFVTPSLVIVTLVAIGH